MDWHRDDGDYYPPGEEPYSSSEEGSEGEYKPPGERAPFGYMAPEAHTEYRGDLQMWGDYVWIKPYGRRIAILFRAEYVQDEKWAKPSDQREESRNEGDVGYTWHHTDQFRNGKCLMQLVPTLPHSKISHIGGVAISKLK